MKDKELKLNASGYYDEPCYKTIQAMDVPKPGEIWTHAATGYYMLVVATQGSILSTLRLTDQEKEGTIPVMCKTKMYTTPIMLGYCFQQAMGQFVKCVKEEEFTEVRLAVVDALGLQDVNTYVQELKIAAADMLVEHNERDAQQNTINDLVKRNAELLEERDKLLNEVGGYGETIKKQGYELQAKEKNIIMLGESLAKVEREADKAAIYKEMYMTLLDKVISVRGGSVNE